RPRRFQAADGLALPACPRPGLALELGGTRDPRQRQAARSRHLPGASRAAVYQLAKLAWYGLRPRVVQIYHCSLPLRGPVMILGDYIDFGRPFPSGFRGLAAQFFRDRSDGDWDYFPRGFGEPGYRVNATMRQKIL